MKYRFCVTFMVASFIAFSTGLLALPDMRIYYSLLTLGFVGLWLIVMAIDRRLIELRAEYDRLLTHGGYRKCESCGALYISEQWCPMCGGW